MCIIIKLEAHIKFNKMSPITYTAILLSLVIDTSWGANPTGTNKH